MKLPHILMCLILASCTTDCPTPTTCTVYCYSADGYTTLTIETYLEPPFEATYRCQREFAGEEGCWSVDCDCR